MTATPIAGSLPADTPSALLDVQAVAALPYRTTRPVCRLADGRRMALHIDLDRSDLPIAAAVAILASYRSSGPSIARRQHLSLR